MWEFSKRGGLAPAHLRHSKNLDGNQPPICWENRYIPVSMRRLLNSNRRGTRGLCQGLSVADQPGKFRNSESGLSDDLMLTQVRSRPDTQDIAARRKDLFTDQSSIALTGNGPIAFKCCYSTSHDFCLSGDAKEKLRCDVFDVEQTGFGMFSKSCLESYRNHAGRQSPLGSIDFFEGL
jgi:hypothetical protein